MKETLLYRTTSGEYADEIYQDLINIMSLGIVIESVTCDGHKSIIRAIKDANKWIKDITRNMARITGLSWFNVAWYMFNVVV